MPLRSPLSPIGGQACSTKVKLSVTCSIGGCFPPHAVVDGTVVVRDASSRNRIFVVDCGDASSFVLKQGTSPEGVAAVAYEAAVYKLLGQRGQRITDYLPAVWDTTRWTGSCPRQGEWRPGFAGSPSAHRPIFQGARQLGRRCPRRPSTERQRKAVSATPERPTPWVLSVHQPNLSIFRDASSAALELIRIVQSAPELGDRLDALRRSWEPACLIHHDVKWDNLIACPTDSAAEGDDSG